MSVAWSWAVFASNTHETMIQNLRFEDDDPFNTVDDRFDIEDDTDNDFLLDS